MSSGVQGVAYRVCRGLPGSGFRDSGFRVLDSRFEVYGSGFRGCLGSRFGVSGFQFEASSSGFSGFVVSLSGFKVFGFRIGSSTFRVLGFRG